MIGILRPSTHSVALLLPVVAAMVLTSFLLLALMLGGWRITSRAGAVLTSSYFAMVALNVFWIRGGFPCSVDGAATNAGELPVAPGDELPATGRAEFHFLDELPLFVPTVLGPPAARRGGLSGPTSGGGSRLHARRRRGWSVGHRGRRHRHRMRSGVLHHPELFFHVGALVDPRDRRPRDPVEEALSRVALRGGTNEAVNQDQGWEDFRDISDHRMHNVEVPVDRDDPEREDFLADRAGENRLEQDRVDEPDRPPEEQ